jgi:GNAT superfamily N-acetyltransferase
MVGGVVMVGPTSGLQYRHIRHEWAGVLEHLELSSFPTSNPDDLYHEYEFEALAHDFPTGCFVGFDGDEAVAMGVGIRSDFDLENPIHTIHDIMPTDGRSGHVPDGPWYYGTSIAVRPTHRRKGIGKELYHLRKGVCIELNLRGIVAGGVLPGYGEHKDKMCADEYIDAVKAGALYDPTLTFQLENGFDVPCALPNYIEDPKTNNNAALIIWHNPDHQTDIVPS